MHVLLATGPLAPDAPAGAVAAAMADGWRAGSPGCDVRALPLADGGPGTLEVIAAARGGRLEVITVTGPTGAAVPAQVCLTGPGRSDGAGRFGTAWLDPAEVLGARRALESTAERSSDLATELALHGSSRGAAELLETALAAGVGRIVVTAGAQGVHDGGAGLLGALGGATGEVARLLDSGGLGVGALGVDPATDAALAAVVARARERLAGVDLVVAATSDVPLFGLHGANAELHRAAGVEPYAAQELERTLGHLYARLDRVAGEAPLRPRALPLAAATEPAGHEHAPGHRHGARGRRRSGLDAGSGCGGGIAAALQLLGARLLPGAEVVAAEVGLAARVEALGGQAVVVTAVPALDGGVLAWSIPAVVGAEAAARALPVVAVAPDVRTSARELAPLGISAAYPLRAGRRAAAPTPRTGAQLLSDARARAERLARTWTPVEADRPGVRGSDRNN